MSQWTAFRAGPWVQHCHACTGESAPPSLWFTFVIFSYSWGGAFLTRTTYIHLYVLVSMLTGLDSIFRDTIAKNSNFTSLDAASMSKSQLYSNIWWVG